jgi:Predicted ABC-type transport system involved in lysophospholipase L1 biosynthesis, permease component
MIEFSTMLSTTGRDNNKSLFTRIKTVDAKYPLYGEVSTNQKEHLLEFIKKKIQFWLMKIFLKH